MTDPGESARLRRQAAELRPEAQELRAAIGLADEHELAELDPAVRQHLAGADRAPDYVPAK